jgi:ADP-dependent NAD(P)H-hydrate dehydratase
MPKSRRNKPHALRVTRALLQEWPLPRPQGDDDKNARGSVLVVGGEVSLPGALVLAGIAALRAGAGKLQIATCRSIAPFIGIAVPESLSLGLDETQEGHISPAAASALHDLIEKTDAVLIGPGMKGHEDEREFVRNLLGISAKRPIVLDAGALDALADSPALLHGFGDRAVITPHAGEMSRIAGKSESEIQNNSEDTAIEAASTLNAIVLLKGSRTYIASPAGDLFCYDAGDVGLATSGSGDTLAGVVAGLIARGATPLHASLWGVFLHGSAGNRLAKKIGRIGYLARELLDEIPPVMNRV